MRSRFDFDSEELYRRSKPGSKMNDLVLFAIICGLGIALYFPLWHLLAIGGKKLVLKLFGVWL